MHAELIERVEIAPGLAHFAFRAATQESFRFTPGQFVSLSAEIGGKMITRAYSIASAPNDSPEDPRRFDLYLNQAPEGRFSNYLFQMKPGESVEMAPPLGTFILRQPPRDSLFIATGTGIAPFRSIIRTHLNSDSPRVTLLFGVRHASHLAYRAEFEELARQYSNFRFWPTVSRPDADWDGLQGHVQQHLEEALQGLASNGVSAVDVYICGLKEMVDDVRSRLKAAGFDRKQVFYEKYD